MNRDVIGGEGLAKDTVNDTLSTKGPRIVVERPKVQSSSLCHFIDCVYCYCCIWVFAVERMYASLLLHDETYACMIVKLCWIIYVIIFVAVCWIIQVVFCPSTRLYVMYFHLDHYQMITPHYRKFIETKFFLFLIFLYHISICAGKKND